MDWCTTKADAVTFVGYDIIRWIWNSLHSATSLALKAIKLVSENIHFVLPSGVVIPILTNGEVSFDPLPNKTFWAIRLKMDGVKLIQHGLPKTPLRDVWTAFVAPFDTFIDGTEYWPYLDRATGEIKQGILFDPVRKFGILTDSPFLFRDIAIIGVLLDIMHKMKLDVLVYYFLKSLVSGISMQVAKFKARKLKQRVDEINVKTTAIAGVTNEVNQDLAVVDGNIDLLISSIVTQLATAQNVNQLSLLLESKFQQLESLLGVRLLLR